MLRGGAGCASPDPFLRACETADDFLTKRLPRRRSPRFDSQLFSRCSLPHAPADFVCHAPDAADIQSYAHRTCRVLSISISPPSPLGVAEVRGLFPVSLCFWRGDSAVFCCLGSCSFPREHLRAPLALFLSLVQLPSPSPPRSCLSSLAAACTPHSSGCMCGAAVPCDPCAISHLSRPCRAVLTKLINHG